MLNIIINLLLMVLGVLTASTILGTDEGIVVLLVGIVFAVLYILCWYKFCDYLKTHMSNSAMINDEDFVNNDDGANIDNTKNLIKEARDVLKRFHELVLVPPANLRGKLDVAFIDSILNTCNDRLESLEYKQFYAIIVKRYGSVELQVYDWLGGALALMYETQKGITKKQIKTLDWMLVIVNVNLKKLGSKTFFTKEEPMGTSIYPL